MEQTLAVSGRFVCRETVALQYNEDSVVGESNVTDNMKKFITQLKDNSARFDGFIISRDVIGFARDSFMVSPSGEFSTNVMKVMLLDEVTIQLLSWLKSRLQVT